MLLFWKHLWLQSVEYTTIKSAVATRYINQNTSNSDAIMDCALFKICFLQNCLSDLAETIKELYPDNACLKYGAIKTYLGVPVLSRNGE